MASKNELKKSMDRKRFDELIAHAERFSSAERGWLKAMQAKYPHSSVVGLLALLADHAFNFDSAEQQRAVALAMCDSSHLEAMMGSAVSTIDDSAFDILNEINTFQEVSFKTAPKSVILSEFLQGEVGNEVFPSGAEEGYAGGEEKKDGEADGMVATETLAVILEKQGKADKALAVYRKLLERNPEKSSNFAAQIERLEALLNSK